MKTSDPEFHWLREIETKGIYIDQPMRTSDHTFPSRGLASRKLVSVKPSSQEPFFQTSVRKNIKDFLEKSGVTLNGNQPWDIQVLDDRFYRKCFVDGSLGLGESYMEGWWECEQIDELIFKLSHAQNKAKALSWNYPLTLLKAILSNRQKKSRAFQIGQQHYDIGNELYQNMLDERMVYSCAVWDDAETLDQAQENKLKLICEKLNLQKGMKILDIGCGWGSFAKYAAENYDVEVVGITVSEKQKKFAEALCKNLPVTFQLQDYRDLKNIKSTYDRIVSVGMFEHVGYKNYQNYMSIVRKCLKDGGLFFLQTIGNGESHVCTDPWIEKYIFPNSMIPSVTQIGKSIEGLFSVESLKNYGAHYDKTLMAWKANFEKNWLKIQTHYNKRFYRMWRYYLLSCAGLFRAKGLHLWQLILSPIE